MDLLTPESPARQLDPLKLEPIGESDLPVPTAEPAVPEEPPVEPVAARTARRNLATHIRGPKDGIPGSYGDRLACANQETRAGHVRFGFGQRLRRYMEVAVVYSICGRMDKGVEDRVERGLEDAMHVFLALLAVEQSNSQPGGLIGKHWSLVEAEPFSYRTAGDLAYQTSGWERGAKVPRAD